jgi:hypothetical protein
MSKEMKVKKVEDTPFDPKMLLDEDRPGAVKIKARDFSILEAIQESIKARKAQIEPEEWLEEKTIADIPVKSKDHEKWISIGRNTKGLWVIAKAEIIYENPQYIQQHGSSDEAILFLILSRYIDDYVPSSWLTEEIE